MRKLDYVPNGLIEILNYYGNPDTDNNFKVDQEWYDANISDYKLPFPLRLAWNVNKIIEYLPLHMKVAESFLDAMKEIGVQVGVQELRKLDMDRTAGTFCFRPVKNGTALSTHSWGMAVDLNSHVAQWGCTNTQLCAIVEVFKRRGWVWGGDWKAPYIDEMHLQAARNY